MYLLLLPVAATAAASAAAGGWWIVVVVVVAVVTAVAVAVAVAAAAVALAAVVTVMYCACVCVGCHHEGWSYRFSCSSCRRRDTCCDILPYYSCGFKTCVFPCGWPDWILGYVSVPRCDRVVTLFHRPSS